MALHEILIKTYPNGMETGEPQKRHESYITVTVDMPSGGGHQVETSKDGFQVNFRQGQASTTTERNRVETDVEEARSPGIANCQQRFKCLKISAKFVDRSDTQLQRQQTREPHMNLDTVTVQTLPDSLDYSMKRFMADEVPGFRFPVNHLQTRQTSTCGVVGSGVHASKPDSTVADENIAKTAVTGAGAWAPEIPETEFDLDEVFAGSPRED